MQDHHVDHPLDDREERHECRRDDQLRPAEGGQGRAIGDRSEEERGESEATPRWTDGAVLRKGQFAGSVGVARHTQIVGPADVQTGLDVVPAERLGEVTDQLPLRLVLIEGTVAAVDAQT